MEKVVKTTLRLICMLLLTGNVYSQKKLSVEKTGFLIGVQQGKFNGFEFGMERQWKQLKLKYPKTLAVAGKVEYLFEANTIGFKAGPWWKFGRLNFTYGTDLLIASDFDQTKLGLAPNMGFKLIGFHFLAGYNIVANAPEFTRYNKLFVSVRYFIPKKRQFKVGDNQPFN